MSSFSNKLPMALRGRFLALALLCMAVLTGFRTGTPPPHGERAFRGTYEGSIEVPVGVPEQHIAFTVTGTATHLGRFLMTAEGDLNLSTLTLSNSSTTFMAANGDELYTTYSSSGVSNGDGTYTVTAWHEVTGGTGRFEGATGSFITTSLARLMATMETVTITGRVYMTGAINY